MAVVRDTSIVSAIVATATQTRSITVGAGSNRLLLVQVNLGAHGGPGTSGTLSATALKSGGATAMTTDTTNGKALSNLGDFGYTQFFWMADPDVGANSIVITNTGGSGTQDLLSGAVTYTGAGTPVFTKNTGNGTALSVSITMATGDFAVAGGCAGAGIASGSDTQLWALNDNTNSGAGNQRGAERSSGSGSISMTNTLGSADDWGMVGVQIPAAGGAAAYPFELLTQTPRFY